MKLIFKNNIKKVFIYLPGILALIWFLIRVVPKPSRAAYPCQRVAFPLASAFVVWICGIIGSYFVFKRTRSYFKNAKFGFILIVIVFLAILINKEIISSTVKQNETDTELKALADFSEGETAVQPKAIVSIVKSDKAKATDIDSAEIEVMVRRAVELAGGFDDLIHDNITVVIKPNLLLAWLMNDNWEHVTVLPQLVNGVTTDYRIIQAVVNLVRERNPNGKVYIIEGSGEGNTRDNMKRMGWFKIKGVDDFICLDEEVYCGARKDTNSVLLSKVALPLGKALYAGAKNRYYLNKKYFEADVLISMPVLKTHCFTCVTGAVKNVGIGATPVTIYGGSPNPGRGEVINHSKISNYAALHNWIHDFYMCKPVDYTIMDALTGLQHGPSQVTYDPITQQKKNTRCIVASRDALAMDAIESLIIQVDPTKVKYLVDLHNDGFGCADPKYIRVVGERVDRIKDRFLHTQTYALFNDSDPPSISVENYELKGDSLFLNLNTDDQVAKVEIAIEGNLVDSIFLKNFNNIALKPTRLITSPKQVVIYAYDQYLNCSIIYLDGSSTGINIIKPRRFMNVFPNPVSNTLNIELNGNLIGETSLNMYNVSGQNISRILLTGMKTKSFDVSGLPKGTYLLVLVNNGSSECMKVVKE